MQNVEQKVQSVALRRLLLCNQIRELGGLLLPVRYNRLPLFHGLLLSLFRRLYPGGPVPLPYTSRKGAILRAPFGISIIIVLRLLVHRFKPRQVASGLVQALLNRLTIYQTPSSEITGYIGTTDKEEPLIRVCMLLRTMRRYGACIELLIKRLNSGLPTDQTKFWLAFFLREIGDDQSADLFLPVPARPCAPKQRHNQELQSPTASKLKYGVVIATMFDTDIFRASVLSLLDSDFTGQVVVSEEGNHKENVCEEFCRDLPVRYVKNPEWSGVSNVLNLGIEQMDPDTEILIYTHSDVLWPTQWFSQLNTAWDRVYDLDKVQMINLGYVDIVAGAESALTEAFVRGQYEDLRWVLTELRDVKSLMEIVRDSEIRDKSKMFGLARDVWNNKTGSLEKFNGGISVGMSFLMKTWRDIGGFDPTLSIGLDMELLFHGFENRKWGFWLSNSPLIHLSSSDTRLLSELDMSEYRAKVTDTNQAFFDKYGWDQNHMFYTYSSETSIIYHDEIVSAVNDLRFDDTDYIFDDLFERLGKKTLSNCEIKWCPSRPTCRYV